MAHPQVDFEFWDLIKAERWADAQAILDRYHNPLGEFVARTRHRSGGYRMAKGMLRLLGQPCGDPRPPTLPLGPDELVDLEGVLRSFGWLPGPTN